MKYFLILIFSLISWVSFGQQTDIFGKWKTIDDKTGKTKSIVEITERNGKAYGKIIQLFRPPNEDQDPVCMECTDHRKGQKVIGMEIISGLQRDGKEWSGGKILDPENGKEYTCKLWVEQGTLKVRGYIAFIYRTQIWLPAE